MDKMILKAIRRDCHRTMWPCYLLGGFGTLLSFLVPTLAAWLVGDMADNLLALNVSAIQEKLPTFLLAIVLEAIILPLVQMLNSLLLVRRGGRYQTLLMGRILRRPLTALHGETGAGTAEHIMAHAPAYYFIQISKCALPVTVVIYGAALFGTLAAEQIPLIFAIVVLLLAGLPLIRTAALSKLTQKVAALERDYETARTQEEEAMFAARCFYRVNGLTEPCIQGFRSRFENWYHDAGRQKRFLEAIRAIFTYLCDYGAALAVIGIGALLVLNGRMGVGALMTGYLLLPTLSSFYSTIAGQIEDVQSEKDVQSRLTVFYGNKAEDLAEAEEELPTEVPAATQIRLDQVMFAYPGSDRPVLDNWCGAFSAGEAVRIVGANGSGKSTLVRLLSGLYAPQAGRITDENGVLLSKEVLRRLVTIQEQDGYIFQGTVWENLFAEESQRAQAEKLLSDMAFEKPLEYAVTPEAANLSPGEQHKILSVRALLRNSAFLILDEPLNHLDRTGADALLAQLRHRDNGLILISHQELPLPGVQTLALKK